MENEAKEIVDLFNRIVQALDSKYKLCWIVEKSEWHDMTKLKLTISKDIFLLKEDRP